MLAKEDFNDDKKDAGEIGAGHTVTALYEIVPVGWRCRAAGGRSVEIPDCGCGTGASSNELLTVKLRYKAPEGNTSRLMEVVPLERGRRSTSTRHRRTSVRRRCVRIRNEAARLLHAGDISWSRDPENRPTNLGKIRALIARSSSHWLKNRGQLCE